MKKVIIETLVAAVIAWLILTTVNGIIIYCSKGSFDFCNSSNYFSVWGILVTAAVMLLIRLRNLRKKRNMNQE